MKIEMQPYPVGDVKLWDIKPGVPFQRVFNDGTLNDPNYYMIIKDDPCESARSTFCMVVNLATGEAGLHHKSSRGVPFPDGTFLPHGLPGD